MNQACEVLCGCDNCGHDAIYKIPVRRIIDDYDGSDEILSGYYRDGHDDEKVILLCRFCMLPRLKVWWWKELKVATEGEPVHG